MRNGTKARSNVFAARREVRHRRMAATYSREAQDALQALDRLVHRHRLLSLDQGKSAARLITGDENVEFPLPKPEPPARAAPAPAAEPAPAMAPAREAAAQPAPALEPEATPEPQPAAEPEPAPAEGTPPKTDDA